MADQSLAEATANLLLLALEIQRDGVEITDGETLRAKVKEELDNFEKQAERLGFGQADVEDTKYALVATIDEALQFSGWGTKIGWEINPLQAELFGDRNAGVVFFDKLERVRQRSRDVLEVYYLCLGTGFRGRFRINPEEELDKLLKDLAREVGHEEGRLAPKGLRTGPAPELPKTFPFIPASAGVLVLSTLMAIVLFLLLGSATEEAVSVVRVFGG